MIPTLVAGFILVATMVNTANAAQGLRGMVAEIDVAEPLVGASVWLMGIDGEVHTVVNTDSAGNFELPVPDAGWYLIRAHHFGYQGTSTEMQFQEGLIVEVRINLRRRAATTLAPIIITADEAKTLGQLEFQTRLDIVRGKKVQQEQLMQAASGNLRFYLSDWGGFWTRGCRTYYLDGRPVDDWVLDYPLDWVFGIEMYRVQNDAPRRYRDADPDLRNCSVILIWGTTVGN